MTCRRCLRNPIVHGDRSLDKGMLACMSSPGDKKLTWKHQLGMAAQTCNPDTEEVEFSLGYSDP